MKHKQKKNEPERNYLRECEKCFFNMVINMEIQLHFDASAYSVLGNSHTKEESV
jgi:hypothetical protein